MKLIFRSLIAIPLIFFMGTGVVFADKPDRSDGPGHSGKHKQHGERGQSNRDSGYRSQDGDVSISFSFGRNETQIVRDYYGGMSAKGKCPPGLAKKGNGCQPPGQAKQWSKGRPLGAEVRYYDIPKDLRVRLPAPPLNHKYVQVGADLLLIAIGTAVVVDAIDGIF